MSQTTLRAITTDTLGRLQVITDAVSQESQRIAALEASVSQLVSVVSTVANRLDAVNNSLAAILARQIDHDQIVNSLGVVNQASSDLQASLLQLRESVG